MGWFRRWGKGTAERAQLAGIGVRDFFLRYVLTCLAVAVVMVLVKELGVPRQYGPFIVLAVVLGAAWLGGLGPSLVICGVVLAVARVSEGRGFRLSQAEVAAFAGFSVIIIGLGLAGQYRRRLRFVTRKHARKLEDQAQALSLAHIVFCDVAGRVTEWNEGAKQMFGFSSEEALGQDLHELLKTQLPRPQDEIEAELLQSGQWQGEVVHYHKDGTELINATHWILYRDEWGAPIGVAKIHNDVSELRRAEGAIREADRRKDEFLAMLAHELRNPLAPIRMGLELIKLSQDDPKSLEEIRMTMERQTQQLVTLVDDLLDVSRITRGKLELRKTRVSLAEVIQSAVEASRPFIEEARHQLAVSELDPRIHLQADRHRLAQVFSNLLNNAAKFTTTGGQIYIAALREGSDVLVSVKDNGIGIAEEMLEQIFEMFTQIKSPQGPGNSGLGIGLTLVKSLVEMHGGTIDVRSEGPMKGSEFIVRLPILMEAPEESQDALPGAEFLPAEFGRKVLVVDDNLAAVKLLSMVMESLGNTVRTATNGEEAVETAEEFQPELVLMDLGMPKMNGFEAARRIREKPWGKDVLLVALSGWGQEDDKRRTKEAGFDHHLTKPAEPAQLKRLLAQSKSNGETDPECPLGKIRVTKLQ